MSETASSRRRVLVRAALLTGAVGFAGCPTDGPDDGDETGTETATDVVDGATATPDGTETASDPATETGSETETATDSEAADDTSDEKRTVTFEAPHGATIEATAYGNGDCGVVLVPQINMDRGSWQSQAEWIADMGHLALAIDEDPDDRASSVRGAIQYLREEEDVSTVVLVGASSGGEAVVVANAETDATVDGTITLSAAGGEDRASELQGRTLFVVSEDDDDRFVRIARDLHDGAPDPTALVEYEGSAHGQRIFSSEHGDDLQDRIRTVIEDVC